MSAKPAILFLIFNRPEETRQVFAAIRDSKPDKLYIAADGPRPGNIHDAELTDAARAITETIDWTCDVQRLYKTENLGCSLGPRTAFDWFFSKEKEGIILEDDCLPDESFFPFAAEMLERYRDNKMILSINGSNLGFNKDVSSDYFFTRFMNMWGWATWADRADKIDYTLSEWKSVHKPLLKLRSQLSRSFFDFDIDWLRYWKDKFDRTVGTAQVTWWDWQWIYYQIMNNKLSVVPGKNLITNLGFNAAGTHTLSPENPAAALPRATMHFPLKHPAGLSVREDYEKVQVQEIWCGHHRPTMTAYLKRARKKISKK